MTRQSAALALLLCCAASAFADEPASAASAARRTWPSLDDAHCDAYRSSMLSVRSPRDMGTVTLRVEVSAQGEVLGVEVGDHTTTNYFAHVVQQNFAKCRFRPGRDDDVPVTSHMTLRLVFEDHPPAPNAAACPVPTTREQPPEGAMAAVKLRIRFLPTGRTASVDVLQASGFPAFDDAAVKAYRQCHFDPGATGQPTFQEEWVTTLKWGG